MMKKKALLATAALSATLIAVVLAGCNAGVVTSDLTMYKDGSGVKTITVEVLGDNSTMPDTDGWLVGNNSAYMLVWGNELAEKVKSYSALEDLNVTATERGEDTVLTISYSFDSIADYNEKTKILAADDASLIQDATFTESGTDAEGNTLYTLREYTQNTKNSIDNLVESLFNDETAFSPKGEGDVDSAEEGPDLDLGTPQYGYTTIYAVTSVTITVGEESKEIKTYEWTPEVGGGKYLEVDEWIEVTGVPLDNPGNSVNIGLIVGCTVAGVVVIAGVVVAIVLLNKKKKAKPTE